MAVGVRHPLAGGHPGKSHVRRRDRRTACLGASYLMQHIANAWQVIDIGDHDVSMVVAKHRQTARPRSAGEALRRGCTAVVGPMGRRERQLSGDSALSEFARLLRQERTRAGQPTYRELATMTHYSVATLARAAGGNVLPSLDVTLAYAAACGADVPAWRKRWHDVSRRLLAAGITTNAASASGQSAEDFATPAQLPLVASSFVGREAELEMLNEMLNDGRGPGAPAIVAIVGAAGVGKTTLAVQWAHCVRQHFPDGILFANMRGHDPASTPTPPSEQLTSFLKALGIGPAQIPKRKDDRATLFRSALDGRRVLVVLDNVASADQARPFLLGAPGCVVVLTSRNRLSGLVSRYGAMRITVELFSPVDAVALLRQTIGEERADVEPAAIDRLAELCDRMPLALRVAAERAGSHTSMSLGALADQLAAERSRLDVLAEPDDDFANIRAVLSWSYRSLSAEQACVFRILGLHPGPEVSAPAAGAMTQLPPDDVAPLLEGLVANHLLEELGPARYRFHDLLRLYATERAIAEDSPAKRMAAIERVLRWYLHSTHAAARVLRPHALLVDLKPPDPFCEPLAHTGYDDALKWFELEHANLVAAVDCAAKNGFSSLAAELAVGLFGYFALSKHWRDWISTHETGLREARRASNRPAELALLDHLGMAYAEQRRFTLAVNHFECALHLSRDAGDKRRVGQILLNLGTALYLSRDTDKGISCFLEALDLSRETANRHLEAMTMNNLGEAYAQRGELDKSLVNLEAALLLFEAEVHCLAGTGSALDSLGYVHLKLGNCHQAVGFLQRAIAVKREAHNAHGQAITLRRLGDTFAECQRPWEAQIYWQQALKIFEELGDPAAEDILSMLAWEPDPLPGHLT